jgi:hypothetical protein
MPIPGDAILDHLAHYAYQNHLSGIISYQRQSLGINAMSDPQESVASISSLVLERLREIRTRN